MKTVHVVSGIILKDGKILSAQRGGGKYKGKWEFPGGKVETGESPKDALKRELMEEMDVEIEVKEKFISIEYSYPDFNLEMDCYICNLITEDIKLNYHTDIRWLLPEHLKSVTWLDADIEVIEKLEETYG